MQLDSIATRNVAGGYFGPHAPTFTYTIVQANQPLGKLVSRGDDGALSKVPLAEVTHGAVVRRQASSLADFLAHTYTCGANECLQAGIPLHDVAALRSRQHVGDIPLTELPVVVRGNDGAAWPDGPAVMVLDHDQGMPDDALLAALRSVPGLEGVTFGWKPSASSCIYDATTGEELAGVGGQHVFMIVTDGRGIPDLGKRIVQWLWLRGHGASRVTERGRIVHSTVIDPSVWQPGRFVFIRATTGLGLVQRLAPWRIHHDPLFGEGAEQWLKPCDVPELTAEQGAEVLRLQRAAESALADEAAERARQWTEKRIADGCDRDDVARAAKGEALGPGFMLKHRGGAVAVRDVCCSLGRWVGAKFADPDEPDYHRGDTSVAMLKRRSNGVPYIESMAHGGVEYVLDYRACWAAGFEGAEDMAAALVQQHAGDDDGESITLSDVHLSRRLVDSLLAGRFQFDHGAGQWRVDRAGAWQPCVLGESTEAAKRLGPLLLREAADEADTDKRSRLLKLAQRAMSAAGIAAALKLAESDPKVAVPAAAYDRNPDVINAMNGAVHLSTGELMPHSPDLMLSRQCAVPFERTPTPMFTQFLNDISCSDPDWIDYMQRFLGYVLSGHVREEVMAFWLGHGANGKSVLANILRRILGSYSTSVPADFLMASKRDAEGATPSLAALPGARLALANEVEAGSRISAQRVKVAVSTEAIAARALYGQPFTFVPTHKVIVRGNHKPIVVDTDEGIWRRWHLVPFDAHFGPEKRDPHLEDKLMAEAPGILAWMVDGFREYLRRGLRPARRVAAASAQYRAESDLLGQWLAEFTEADPRGDCEQVVAYSLYRQWCVEQGLRFPAKKSFTRALCERGFTEGQRTTGTRARTYRGLRLRDPLADMEGAEAEPALPA